MGDHQDAEEFGDVGAGASKTYPQQCSALRKGGHVMIKGRPCKIVEMSTSKTGKHGHAKVHLVAIDIFTAKKLEDICPSTHNMEVPIVARKDYQLNDIDGEFMSLMDDAGVTREDIQVPEGEVGDDIRKRFEDGEDLLVSVLCAMDEETAVAVKLQSKWTLQKNKEESGRDKRGRDKVGVGWKGEKTYFFSVRFNCGCLLSISDNSRFSFFSLES